MGLRIHKIMGYGLTDVKCKDYEIIDERFNKDVTDIDRDLSGFVKHLEDILKQKQSSFLEEVNVHLSLSAVKSENPWLTNREYNNVVHYDPEFGLDNVICFVPPCMVNQWVRYDNSIDYYSDYLLEKNNYIYGQMGNEGRDWYEILDIPLYPFDGYINKETGERCESKIHQTISAIRTAERNLNLELLKTNPYKKIIDTNNFIINNLLKSNDDSSISNWREKYTPIIPGDLIQYLLYNNVFKDKQTIWQLQPMIYTYWS